MIFSLFITMFCSLSLTLDGTQNYSSALVTSRDNDKSVVFEGSYFNMPADEVVSEINDKPLQEIKIYFFIKPNNLLEALRTNRPSISNENLSDTQSELKAYREQIQENIFFK